MQPINMTMIYYRDKKLQRRLNVSKADVKTIEKTLI